MGTDEPGSEVVSSASSDFSESSSQDGDVKMPGASSRPRLGFAVGLDSHATE